MKLHPVFTHVRTDLSAAFTDGRLAPAAAADAVGHLARQGDPAALDHPGEVKDLLLRLTWLLFVRASSLDGRYMALAPMNLSFLSSGQRSWDELLDELGKLEHVNPEAETATLDDLLRTHGAQLVDMVHGGLSTPSGASERMAAMAAQVSDKINTAAEAGDWANVPIPGPDADLVREHLSGLATQSALQLLGAWGASERAQEADDVDGALASVNRAIELDPGMFESYVRRARMYFALEQPVPAGADLERAVSLEPRACMPYAMRAELRAISQDMKGSLDDWIAAVERAPEHVPLRIGRAYTLVALGQLDEALIDFDEAVKLAPGQTTPLYNRADGRMRAGKLDGAIADYGRVLELEPGDAQALLNRGTARMMKRDFPSALTDFAEAIKIRPGEPMGYAKRGAAYFSTEWAWEAYLDGITALAICEPDWPHADQVEGLVRRSIQNMSGGPHCQHDPADARARVDHLQNKAPGMGVVRFCDLLDQHLPAENIAYHLLRGEMYITYGQWREAHEAYRNALAVDDGNAEAWLGLGRAMLHRNEPEPALQALEQARTRAHALDGNATFELYLLLGRTRGVLQDLAGAIEAFEEALALKPDRADVWFYKGVHLDLQGDKKAALAAYDQAVTHDNTFSAAWFNRACEHALLGHREQALADLVHAADLKPSWAAEAAKDVYFQAYWDDAGFKSTVARYDS